MFGRDEIEVLGPAREVEGELLGDPLRAGAAVTAAGSQQGVFVEGADEAPDLTVAAADRVIPEATIRCDVSAPRAVGLQLFVARPDEFAVFERGCDAPILGRGGDAAVLIGHPLPPGAVPSNPFAPRADAHLPAEIVGEHGRTLGQMRRAN